MEGKLAPEANKTRWEDWGALSRGFLCASAKAEGWAGLARIKSQAVRVCGTVCEKGLSNAPGREKLEHLS